MKEQEKDLYQIKQMPDKKLLQDFLRSLHGWPQVIFNLKTGLFERVEKNWMARPKARKMLYKKEVIYGYCISF